ncbi:MAG TPA: glycosyltransferase [Tepidisphaeraceae bacterium]|nr:glycosyltransferase [Tepidisphaeraceae bacterium]
MNNIGVIAIGRNEGERLRRCLESVVGRGWTVVYVDSNSSDGSVELARSLGAQVVELDTSLPFSAARARNSGFERLLRSDPQVRLVQFVDGDCQIVDGWIERASRELEMHNDVAVVCGRRRERDPDASVYNRLADLEWDTAVGETQSCGGDALMRVDAFQAVGGFDASVVAGEEPELCQRLRAKGWKILRIDSEMTQHDSAMLHLSQWWRRAVRSGYGWMDIRARFPGNEAAARQVRSSRTWSLGWLAAAIIALGAGTLALNIRWGVFACLLVVLLFPLQMLRIAAGVRQRVGHPSDAIAYAFLTMLSKWANVIGQAHYWKDRRAGRIARMIEYKHQSPSGGSLVGEAR